MVHAAQRVQPPAIGCLVEHGITILRVEYDAPAALVQRDGGRVHQAERVEEGAEAAFAALRIHRGDRIGDRALAVVIGVGILRRGGARQNPFVGEVGPEPGAVKVVTNDAGRRNGRPGHSHLPELQLAEQIGRGQRRAGPRHMRLDLDRGLLRLAVPRRQVQPGDLQPGVLLMRAAAQLHDELISFADDIHDTEGVIAQHVARARGHGTCRPAGSARRAAPPRPWFRRSPLPRR